MATKLKHRPRTRKGGRIPRYPWDQWFDGGTWELTAGKDYHCTPHTMDKLIRRTAALRGLVVSVYKTGKEGVLQLFVDGKVKKAS